ncbi:MAG TPA: hypothetical protein VNU01_01230 [Egibacteraceae bacterium]|nr:hypothetical protein [Egibacteraceae bacterium]
MAFFLVVAMALGVGIMPAAADEPRAPDAGVFQGTAQVGKSGDCDNEGGAHNVTGGGIGAPVVNGPKNAQYSINAPDSVVSVSYGVGSLRLCGFLTGPLGIKKVVVDDAKATSENDLTVPVGASCVSTKGWGGKGKATFNSVLGEPATTVIYISNLGWKATVGGTFLVTADTGGTSKKKADLLVAVVQALSEGAVIGCLEKVLAMQDKSGLTPDPFTVVASYALLPVENPQDKKPPKQA